MADLAAELAETAKKGWISGVVASILKIGAGHPARVQIVPEILKGDVGLERREKRRGWWEYR